MIVLVALIYILFNLPSLVQSRRTREEGGAAQDPEASLSMPTRRRQTQQTQAIPIRDFDATTVAKTLYQASEGGAFGVGTDEDVIFSTLRQLNPDQYDLVKEAFKDLYKNVAPEGLTAMIKDEFDFTDGVDVERRPVGVGRQSRFGRTRKVPVSTVTLLEGIVTAT